MSRLRELISKEIVQVHVEVQVEAQAATSVLELRYRVARWKLNRETRGRPRFIWRIPMLLLLSFVLVYGGIAGYFVLLRFGTYRLCPIESCQRHE